MSRNPLVLRAQKALPKTKKAGIFTAAAIVAVAAAGTAVPVVADVLTTASPDPTPLVEINEAQTALDDATVALTAADSLNASITASGLTLSTPAVSTTELAEAVAKLDDMSTTPPQSLAASAEDITTATDQVVSDTFTLQAELNTAKMTAATTGAATQLQTQADAIIAQREAEAAAAAQAQAEAEAAAAEAEAAAAAASTPDGARSTARQLAADKYGWGEDQFSCLDSLWTKESGWNSQAENPSGAYGIPQSLPGSKMSSIADDWATNATTQILWGLQYIDDVYGTPCSAWGHSQATNWY